MATAFTPLDEEKMGAPARGNPDLKLLKSPGSRDVLHSSQLAQVERSYVSAAQPPPSGFESRFQVVLPYLGLFAYRVGSQSWLIDTNKTLFISPGWEYRDEHPVPDVGHGAILINPSRDTLDEVCGSSGPKSHHAFLAASLPSTPRLSLLTHSLLCAEPAEGDCLAKDEWIVHALNEAINGHSGEPAPHSRVPSKAVARAKEVLHARNGERLSLQEIAEDAGVSPVYLTQEFTRREGTPLYQYQLRLRLSRALLELPHCEDITGLALDLGFSSHSHFGSVFRKVFGMTPSEYRASKRAARGWS